MKLDGGSYNNAKTVRDETEILVGFQSRSQQVYQSNNSVRHIFYGEDAREKIDWFISSQPLRGTIIFIHGGYWQSCNKEDFAFIVTAPLHAGFDVMLIEYSLAPLVPLQKIHQQIGAALDVIYSLVDIKMPVYLSGHSAGGHLAACWQTHPLVTATLAISGIFELSPLLATTINQQLQLTAEDVSQLSPLRHPPASPSAITLYYGTDELPELIAQSERYAQALSQHSVLVECVAVAGANHYTILDALFSTDGLILKSILNNR